MSCVGLKYVRNSAKGWAVWFRSRGCTFNRRHPKNVVRCNYTFYTVRVVTSISCMFAPVLKLETTHPVHHRHTELSGKLLKSVLAKFSRLRSALMLSETLPMLSVPSERSCTCRLWLGTTTWYDCNMLSRLKTGETFTSRLTTWVRKHLSHSWTPWRTSSVNSYLD